MRVAREYKQLSEEHQPQPRLPEGYGVVHMSYEIDAGKVIDLWCPVRLVLADDATVNFDYFGDPRFFGPLHCRSRRRAIGYIWRWYRRYGDAGWSLIKYDLRSCSAGIPGHLYQNERITVASAAERLGLTVKDIHTIRKATDLKARLEHGKVSRGLYYNRYTINLAYLEAYLDVHGYGLLYPSVAELRKYRQLPAVVWCV